MKKKEEFTEAEVFHLLADATIKRRPDLKGRMCQMYVIIKEGQPVAFGLEFEDA